MSEIFKLNTRDLIKGLAVTLITTILTGFVGLLQSGTNFGVPELKLMLLTSITAGLSYLIKNFVSDQDGKLGGKL